MVHVQDVGATPIAGVPEGAKAASHSGPWYGYDLLAALEAAETWVRAHQSTLDALNVYPVPDGDTGANMSITLHAAILEARAISDQSHAGRVAQGAAHGALLGARGNSGVILSQLLAGIASGLHDREYASATDIAAALREAALKARQAVVEPSEGTILTVADMAAQAAIEASQSNDCTGVIEAAWQAAQKAVARTTEQLDVLRNAGVVDAGGHGYALMLEGILRHLRGQRLHIQDMPHMPVTAHEAHGAFGYCTECIIVGQDLPIDTIKRELTAFGSSTLVVGDEDLVRIHVHTEDPGRVLSYALSRGPLSNIKIDNMQLQVNDKAALHESIPSIPSHSVSQGHGRVGIVAVAPGSGIAGVLSSLGADAIVGGNVQLHANPEDMLSAINSVAQKAVIVLPNSTSMLQAATQAAASSDKKVKVIPTATVPQGIAALLAYTPEADLSANVKQMDKAIHAVRTGEVTVASCDAEYEGLSVRSGESLGLIDGHAVIIERDRDSVALNLIERMLTPESDVLTLYYGADLTAPEAERMASEIQQRFPGLAVEVVNGEQPYPYILSIE